MPGVQELNAIEEQIEGELELEMVIAAGTQDRHGVVGGGERHIGEVGIPASEHFGLDSCHLWFGRRIVLQRPGGRVLAGAPGTPSVKPQVYRAHLAH